MKLCNPKWQYQINCGEGEITAIIIENPLIMRDYVSELLSQIDGGEGDFILSEDNEEISIPAKMASITSPISFSIEDKRIQTRLNSQLKSFIVSSEMYVETNGIISAIAEYGSNVVDKFYLPISFKEPESEALIKMLGFFPEYEYENKLDKILEYMNLMNSFCGIGCFVLIGMSWFFSEQELSVFFEEIKSLKHSLMLIENKPFREKSVNTKLKQVIIDSDGCEIF